MPRPVYWMAKVDRAKRVLTPKPVRLYYDRVFDHYWASRGPGDHPEGFDGPGTTRGPFRNWTAFVSEDREEVVRWIDEAEKWARKHLKPEALNRPRARR